MKENLSRNSLLYFAILALGFVLFIMLIPQASESLFSHKQNALKKNIFGGNCEVSLLRSVSEISSWNLSLRGYRWIRLCWRVNYQIHNQLKVKKSNRNRWSDIWEKIKWREKMHSLASGMTSSVMGFDDSLQLLGKVWNKKKEKKLCETWSIFVYTKIEFSHMFSVEVAVHSFQPISTRFFNSLCSVNKEVIQI